MTFEKTSDVSDQNVGQAIKDRMESGGGCAEAWEAAQEIRDEKTDSVISFIKNPPLPGATKPFYRLFFQAAVTSLPKQYAELLEMKQVPVSTIRPVTKSVLKGMRAGIGPESPIENAALERLRRAGVIQ